MARIGLQVNGTFYNALDFWDEENGIAFGDAIDGRLLILRTSDGGDTWQELPFEQRPEVQNNQYAFAASGTCLRTQVMAFPMHANLTCLRNGFALARSCQI